ncbi:MAG TPA: hypothetical protein VKD91_22440 [Pyrinomonadaceae bacterium]|nr:hypothetical protein [Pyrinomonadaceae bacterium]
MPFYSFILRLRQSRSFGFCLFAFTFLLFTFSFRLAANTQTQTTRGVIRLKVRIRTEGTSRDLARKRFFLIKGSLDENKTLIAGIKQAEVMSRECYYRSKGASDALVKWLQENDCESVYCREIEERYVTGNEPVPEFKAAYEAGLRSFKSPDIARRWLTVNLPEELRSGYYNQKQRVITELISQAEAATKTNVLSVMTDRIGGAYLTDLEPGTYTISNLVGSETGKQSVLWICEKDVKPTNLTTGMRQMVLSNEKDPRNNCEIIERPLPTCAKSALIR